MGGPLCEYVVQVHVVVLCACVHIYVDTLISSQVIIFLMIPEKKLGVKVGS